MLLMRSACTNWSEILKKRPSCVGILSLQVLFNSKQPEVLRHERYWRQNRKVLHVFHVSCSGIGLPSWRAARTLQFLKLILSCRLLVLGLYQQLVGTLLLGLACLPCLPLFYRLVLPQAFGYPAFAFTTWKCKILATHARLSWNCPGKQAHTLENNQQNLCPKAVVYKRSHS